MLKNLYRSLEHTLTTLNFEQVVLLTLVVAVIGVVCMRGFGTRSDY